MSITTDEIKFYGSAVMAEDDVTTAIGGAIALTKKIEFTQMSGNSTLEAVSSSVSDTTQTITVTGRNAAGTIISSAVVLTGTSPVALDALTFERILKATLSGTAVGTVTIRNSSGGTVWSTMEPGLTEVRVPFYNSAADPSGGAEKTYYEKIFVKNTNATLSLLSGQISEQSDPTGLITFGVAATLNDSGTNGANNRQVAPGAITFNNSAKNVITGELPATEYQGIWLELRLPAGNAAQKSTYTLKVTGTSI